MDGLSYIQFADCGLVCDCCIPANVAPIRRVLRSFAGCGTGLCRYRLRSSQQQRTWRNVDKEGAAWAGHMPEAPNTALV
jgi:hypothetical protein